MKHFFIAFFSVLLLCMILLAAGLGLTVFASFLSDILPSKEMSVNNDEGKKAVTVVIDPGHGGRDGGAVGVNGVQEKELNLDLGKKLAAALESRGIAVVMTRTEDIMLHSEGETSEKNGDLKARVELTEQTENAILVSLHMNKYPDPSVKGITFYFSPNHPESRALAISLRDEIGQALSVEKPRPLKEADSSIYILHRVTRPAVLVECGFLSNAYEVALLSSEDYRARFAEALAQGIQHYLEEKDAKVS